MKKLNRPRLVFPRSRWWSPRRALRHALRARRWRSSSQTARSCASHRRATRRHWRALFERSGACDDPGPCLDLRCHRAARPAPVIRWPRCCRALEWAGPFGLLELSPIGLGPNFSKIQERSAAVISEAEKELGRSLSSEEAGMIRQDVYNIWADSATRFQRWCHGARASEPTRIGLFLR